MLYLFNILPIRYVISFIYGKMEKVLLTVSSCNGCVGVALLVCLLINLFISFLSCPFFSKACFRWLNSVFLSEMVKALCTNELITDCFCDGWCDLACKYLSVRIGSLYTWWPRVQLAFLVTRTSRKEIFIFFYVYEKADIERDVDC